MLENILTFKNLEKSLKAVERNKGASGIDNQQFDSLRPFIYTHYQALRKSILESSYKPSPVRKVEIPKPGGGMRMLGIPTVLDRFIQQCIYQFLSPLYEIDFSPRSYGFRPGKNAHQAVKKAQEYLQRGYTWIIELDLEKFFDKMNHQKLLCLVSEKIRDIRLLKLIGCYLRSGIMEGGVTSPRSEGTPQGSPLSPLLSNIMLHELDKELQRRGLKYVRYADDCSIYVRSEKSAKRVAESISKYIEDKLLLKVNRSKTRISRPKESQLLGFSFYKMKGEFLIRLGAQTLKSIKEKCKKITSSRDATAESIKLKKLDDIIRGWVNYFKIAQAMIKLEELDEQIRTRLRIAKWRNWKRIRTKISNLIKLGVSKSKAYQWGNTSKGPCRIAHSPILKRTLTKSFWKKQGYQGFSYYYRQTQGQPSMF
ncbi:MAG: group II intron reverse transcriptase/maturase [Sporocytophaga sp.]|nr:group II intron reverse transcriptase/maturase [Sporocytophaga sp.]